MRDADIARELNLPRATVHNWRDRGSTRHDRLSIATPDWRPPDDRAYSYLLGLYLGDGHITHAKANSFFLRIVLDARYEGIIVEATAAIATTFPETAVRRYRFDKESAAITLHASHPALGFAFPQCGPGLKHKRPIVLEPWQREITHVRSDVFLRGLIHSDGCRTVNRFSTHLPSGRVARYEYVRYFFSNLSEDIRGLFCEHCELLGIRWTQSNPRNISVAHRDSVAKLEAIVGPKE